MQKRQTIIDDKRKFLQEEWKKLKEEDAKVDEFRKEVRKKYIGDVQQEQTIRAHLSDNERIEFELNKKLEIERLKVERDDLEKKLQKQQNLFNSLYDGKTSVNKEGKIKLKSTNESKNDENGSDELVSSESSVLNSKYIRKTVREAKLSAFDELADDDDDSEMKEVVRNAKLKVKLKYIQAKKEAIDNPMDLNKSISYESEDTSEANDYHLNIRKLDSEISEHKQYLLEELNKEKDSLKIANELLEKHKQSLYKRKIRLEMTQNELKSEEEMIKDLMHGKGDVGEKNKQKLHLIEERRLILEKEALDLERLGLNIKSNKRLVKQKADQLNLLEHNIVNKIDNDDDEDEDDEDDDEKTEDYEFDIENDPENNEERTFNSSNIDDLIVKLKKVQKRGNSSSKNVNMNKIQPLVKSITKLTHKLNKGIEGIELSQTKSKTESFIEKKWDQYFNNSTSKNLNATMPSMKSEPSTSNQLPTLIRGAWETSPTYHKLTYDSNNKILNEKYSKYIGSDNDKFQSTSLINSLHSPVKQNNRSTNVNSLSSSLPTGIQQRINEHREWLRKFKADLINSNQINNSNGSNFVYF